MRKKFFLKTLPNFCNNFLWNLFIVLTFSQQNFLSFVYNLNIQWNKDSVQKAEKRVFTQISIAVCPHQFAYQSLSVFRPIFLHVLPLFHSVKNYILHVSVQQSHTTEFCSSKHGVDLTFSDEYCLYPNITKATSVIFLSNFVINYEALETSFCRII